MSNNSFRKGLVAAALAGLVTTAIAGTPAFAADGVILKANTGTVLAAPVDQTLTLNAALIPTLPAENIAQLKYKVATDGTFAVKTVATGATGAATAYNTVDSSTGVGANKLAATNLKTSYVTAPATSDSTHANTLAVSVSAVPDASSVTTGVAPTYTSATRTVTVTAWIDSNNDNVVDAGEVQQTQTISFLKYSEITGTPAITAPITADQSVSATVAYTNINNEQLTNGLSTVAFTKADGTNLAADTASVTSYSVASNVATITAANDYAVNDVVALASAGVTDGSYPVLSATASSFTVAFSNANVAATAVTGTATRTSTQTNAYWDSVNSYFKSTLVKLGSLASGTGVSAQAQINGHNAGTAATALVTDRTITTFSSAVVTSNTAGVISSTNEVALNKSFQVSATAKDNSSPAVGLAGKTVTYSVTDAALPATAAAAAAASTPATLTINGVTYTNQAALPGATGVAKLSGVTGADGNLVVTASATNHADGNNIAFVFGAENFSSTVTVRETTIALGTAIITSGAASATTAGGTVAVSVKLSDIFGNAVADGLYDAKAHFNTSNNRTTNNTQANDVIVPVVGGVATLNVTDSGTGTGTNSYKIQYQLRDATVGGYGANNPVSIDAAYIVNIKAAADLVPGVVALTGVTQVVDANGNAVVGSYKATGAALSTATFTAYDGSNPQTVASAAYVSARSADVGATITANVSSASTATYAGVAIPTASVTYTLAGAQFKATLNGGDVYTVGSITVPSGTAVSVWSNISGARTVAVTSGSITSNAVVTFPAPAVTAGYKWVWTAPATAQSGTTINYSAVLQDKFGNPVEAGVGSTTPGATVVSFSATTVVGSVTAAVVKTSTTGSVSGSATTQVADKGNLVITATYDADGTGTTYAAVTSTATIVVSDIAGDKAAADAAAAAAAAAAKEQAAKAKTVTATPSVTSSQTGRAVDVSVKALNTAGTAAAGRTVTFTSTGAGSLTATSAVTDANGVATVKLVAGAADAGDGVVTATVDGVSATAATVTFGTTDAQIDIVGNRVTATASFTAGKTVAFYVDGIKAWSKLSAANSDLVINSNLKKGTHTVTVKISGGFVTTEKFIVK